MANRDDDELVARLLAHAPDDGTGVVLLTEADYPVAVVWLTEVTDEETGESTRIVRIVVSDWTTTVETSNV